MKKAVCKDQILREIFFSSFNNFYPEYLKALEKVVKQQNRKSENNQ